MKLLSRTAFPSLGATTILQLPSTWNSLSIWLCCAIYHHFSPPIPPFSALFSIRDLWKPQWDDYFLYQFCVPAGCQRLCFKEFLVYQDALISYSLYSVLNETISKVIHTPQLSGLKISSRDDNCSLSVQGWDLQINVFFSDTLSLSVVGKWGYTKERVGPYSQDLHCI